MSNETKYAGEQKFLGDLSNYNENSELFQLTVLANAILQNEKSCTDFTAIHNQVYNATLNGGSDRLYDRIRMCIFNHLGNGIKYLLVGANGSELMVLMCPIWDDFMDATKKMNEAFLFLDTIVHREKRNVEPIYDMTLTVFKNFLLRTDQLLERLSCAIMQSFAVDRWGRSCAEAKLCSQIILTVSKGDREFFKTHFEDKFIDEAFQYLSSITCTGLVVDYVDTVNREIDSEVHRALTYGNQQTADLVANKAITQLIANKTWFIVESNTGLWTMMAMKYTDCVTKIFNLLMRLDTGIMIVVDAINRYVEHNYYGLPINAEFVVGLLDFKKSMENYLQFSFANDQTIGEMIFFHLKCLLNSNNEIPNCVSLHIGRLFESEITNVEMSDAIDILKYFENDKKDRFEVYYSHHCSVRLLLNKIPDYDREITLLNEIITAFGEKRCSQTLQALLEDLNKLKN